MSSQSINLVILGLGKRTLSMQHHRRCILRLTTRIIVSVLAGFLSPQLSVADVLEIIAKDAIVVIPDKPSAIEKQCAERIAMELIRHDQDPTAALQPANKAAAGLSGDAEHHLILVGKAGS